MVHRVDKVASHFPVIILNTSLISLITDDCTEAWHAFSETDESLILICNLRLILETGEGVQFIFCKRICYVVLCYVKYPNTQCYKQRQTSRNHIMA